MFYHKIYNLIQQKDSIEINRINSREFGEIVQNCKDRNGLPFIKFDFLIACQEIKIVVLVEFILTLRSIFQDNKANLRQAPGHNHENTINQPQGNTAFWSLLLADKSVLLLSIVFFFFIDWTP